MPLQLLPIRADLAPGVPRPFSAAGGTPPYVFSLEGKGSIVPDTVDTENCLYRSPEYFPEDVRDQIATLVVTDSTGATAESEIAIGSPLILLCKIIQRELNLNEGRVYLWDQKINAPEDKGLFVAISALVPKLYGNVNRFNPATNAQEQQSSWSTQVEIDIISKGSEARDRFPEVAMALNSQYSVQQQELNSFSIGIIPTAIRNLSGIDGAAIPYRFNFSVNLMYTVTKKQSAEYFDTFEDPEILVDP